MQLFGGKGKMLGLLLVLAAFGSFYLGDITAFTTSQKAIAGVALFIIVLLVGISLLKPKKTEEDMIAEQDERNQYIELFRSANNAMPRIKTRITSPSTAALFLRYRRQISFSCEVFFLLRVTPALRSVCVVSATALSSILIFCLDTWVNKCIQHIDQQDYETEQHRQE